MKSLLFFGTTLGTLYASLRWEPVLYFVVFLFVLGSAFMIFASLYHHLYNRRHF